MLLIFMMNWCSELYVPTERSLSARWQMQAYKTQTLTLYGLAFNSIHIKLLAVHETFSVKPGSENIFGNNSSNLHDWPTESVHILVSSIKIHTGTFSIEREASVSYCNVWKTSCKKAASVWIPFDGDFQGCGGNSNITGSFGLLFFRKLMSYTKIFTTNKRKNIVTVYENESSCKERWKSELQEFPP